MPEPDIIHTYLPVGGLYEAIVRFRGVAIAVTESSVIVVLPIDGQDKIITIDRSTGATR